MKTQTHIERNLVKIPVDHVNSFKSEEEFGKAMEAEGHFANELPEVREDMYKGIWKEAQGLKEQPAEENTGDNSKSGTTSKNAGASKSGTSKKDPAIDANASGTSTTANGGGPATTGSGSGTTGTSSTTTSS